MNAATTAQPQSNVKTIVSGIVLNEKGNPLESVNVFIAGTLDGDVTDSKGNFRFITTQIDTQVIRASLIGFESASVRVFLIPQDSIAVRLRLRETAISLKEIVVSSSAHTTGDQIKGVTLRSIEVVTTPSAAADIFRAVQTFPGVAAVDEGSGLFVRGGDVSETTILLDQATVSHPYKFETPTGGVFGTIPPFLISGTFFSSGGFSARYGNTLSAILAMESLNLPSRLTVGINAGLAAGSLGMSVPVIPQTLGFRFSGNYTFTDMMFRVNNVRDEFTVTPQGQDANFSVIYNYSGSAQLKIFNFVNTNRVGVRVDEPSFDGDFQGEETSWLHNAQLRDIFSEWLFKGSLSFSRFSSEQNLGSMQLKPTDQSYKARLDFERLFGDGLKLATGGEFERLENIFQGKFPKNPNVFDPDADVYHLNEQIWTYRYGLYTEIETRLLRKLFGSLGVRTDYHSKAVQGIVDPRVSLRYNLSNDMHTHIRWGIYHQFPQPVHFNNSS